MVRKAQENFIDLVKNTYRTLLTRGLKGCYICFVDKNTERFVRSRTEALGSPPVVEPKDVAPPPAPKEHRADDVLPFRRLRPAEVQRYVNAVPLVNLKFAAGSFSAGAVIDPDEVEWVEPPAMFRPQPGLFVAQVVGESMNRRIPNGSWCLFRMNPGGTRQAKVVLAHHRSIRDPEYGGYTVKIYSSEKRAAAAGAWEHDRIVLRPDSDDPSFSALEFDSTSAGELAVIAEFVAVLEPDAR